MLVTEEETYITNFATDEKALNNASEEEVVKYVQIVMDGVEKDNVTALEALGYASYGGNRAFPCDWQLAEKCFLKLMELTDDPLYANTLGYIYYYGRKGKPDYNKAWYYFSIGALGGVYESKYKIADMLIKGLPKQKNYTMACDILNEVYDENLDLFINDYYDCKFADVALRLGGFIKDILIKDPDNFYGYDYEKALYYFMQAKFALKKRMETGDYIGDKSVMKNIDDVIKEVSSSVAFQEDPHHVTGHSLGQLIAHATCKDSCIEATISKDKRKIHIACINFVKEINPFHLFLTIEDLNFCDFVEGFDVVLDKDAEIKIYNTMNDEDPNKFIINSADEEAYGLGEEILFEIKGDYWIDLNV